MNERIAVAVSLLLLVEPAALLLWRALWRTWRAVGRFFDETEHEEWGDGC